MPLQVEQEQREGNKGPEDEMERSLRDRTAKTIKLRQLAKLQKEKNAVEITDPDELKAANNDVDDWVLSMID